MTTLMQASQQWASRPADERFIDLNEMSAKMRDLRDRSRQTIASNRKIQLFPDETERQHRGIFLGLDNGPLVEPIKAIHLEEEGRPIETLWGVTVGATAHARSIPNNDTRLVFEREAGKLLTAA